MFRHAIRRLSRARTFTLASTLTLMLGIGGAAAVFTLVDGVLLRPLPYEHAEQLVDISHTLMVPGVLDVDQSDATYLLYRRDNRVLADIGAYRSAAVNLGTAGGGAPAISPERVNGAFATGSVFTVLHASPKFGRALNDGDDLLGAPPVVVLSEALWTRSFGADSGIVGKRVMIDGVAREVVGVMPEAFQFPDAGSSLWVPLELDPGHTKSAAFDYRAVARLRDGISASGATADLSRLLPTVPLVFPGRLTAASIVATKMRPVIRPLRDAIVGDVGRVLWIVLGSVVLLLVIACANVANLFLARAEGRQRDLAVLSALGASRAAVLGELLSEAMLITVVGGVLGLACAFGGVAFLKSMDAAATIPRLAEVHVNALVVLVTAGTAALVALGVSALPMWRLEMVSLSTLLTTTGRSATTGPARHAARRAFVVAQVAFALMLVSAAGLFARSFAHLRRVNPGFVAERALTFRVALADAEYPTTHDAAAATVRSLDAIAAVPGVQSVGAITKLPLNEEGRQDSAVFIEDQPTPAGGIPDIREINFATRGYFDAMGIPLVAGRLFAEASADGQPAGGVPEVIVSAAFAARHWNGGSALGKRIRMNPTDPWHVIVGVVGSVHGDGLQKAPVDEVYCPLVTLTVAGVPWMPRNIAFVVRTSGEAEGLGVPIRRAIGEVDPTLPLYRLRPLADLLSVDTARTTFTLMLLAIAAAVATIIGALGIYGVISYLVSLRTREIGVRLALGADARSVGMLVARQAVTDALIGVAVGLAGTVAFTRLTAKVTYDVSPTDPASLGGAVAVLLVAAIVASWIPARRAAAMDPVTALRTE